MGNLKVIETSFRTNIVFQSFEVKFSNGHTCGLLITPDNDINGVLKSVDTFKNTLMHMRYDAEQRDEWVKKCEIFNVDVKDDIRTVTLTNQEMLDTIIELINDGCNFFESLPAGVRIGTQVRLSGVA